MKNFAFLFVLLISSIFLFSACGSTPDQSKGEIKVFLNGYGYNQPYKIFTVKSEMFSPHSPYFREENSTDNLYVDYIVLAKKDSQNFLLFVESDGSFPKIVREVVIDSVATITKPQKGTTTH